MYFTRCDNPHAGKSNIQQEAVRKFKDIGKVQFSVVAFNEEFDLNNFYSVKDLMFYVSVSEFCFKV